MSFQFEILVFAPGEITSSITKWTLGRFDIWRKVSTASKRVLDPQSTVCTQISRPLEVDLSFQVESLLLVSHVSRSDGQGEAEPEEERVDGKESPVVEDNPGVSDDRGQGDE